MKKGLIILLAALLVLSIGITSAFAVAGTRRAGYTDANGDGICDARIDSDGDGVCDSCPNSGVCPQDGTGAGYARQNGGTGANFSDADGDGVCDNRPQDGAGAGYARQHGRNK